MVEGLQPVHNYAWAGIIIIFGLLVYSFTRKGRYDHIPAVGSTGFFASYLEAVKLVKGSQNIIQEGYVKYKNGIFRIPELNGWHVLVSGEKLMDELRKAPDDVLSFEEAANWSVALDYTAGPHVAANMYHLRIVRSQLTRSFGAHFNDMKDEMMLAFNEYIPPTDGWEKIKALETVMKIVSRTTNRMFIGTKCRNPEYMKLTIQYTIDLVIAAQIINMFPDFLKPIVGNLFTNVPKAIRTGLKHLGPIIEERKQKIADYGPDYPEKPNDVITWLMNEATGKEQEARNLTLRILLLNFAAIHTTSMTFTHALYYLASRPEYIQPLRDEVEGVISEDGWTKVSMNRMRKLDSFLKESSRMVGLGDISMMRLAMKDFTFSDGMLIPRGTFISAVAHGRHRDNDVYPNGETFDGFRFSKLRNEEGEGTKNQMVATSTEYITFGHGRHACPGRFFAVTELKAMLAYVVLNYDVKMENEGVRPKDMWIGHACIPNQTAEVLFRKRQR